MECKDNCFKSEEIICQIKEKKRPKEDVILLYACGMTPYEIYEKHKLMATNTAYKYYNMFKRIYDCVSSESFKKAIICAMFEIAIEKAKK